MELSVIVSSWSKQLKLQESDTPLIRWCLVAVVILLAWFWLIEPLKGWRDDLDAQVSQNAQKAARLLALKKDAQSWADAESGGQQKLQGSLKELFMQPTDTAAQAAIQTALQQKSANRKVSIVSQKLMAAESEEGVGQKIAIAMDLSGKLVDVLALLDDISRANHLFQIQRWAMRTDKDDKMWVQTIIAGFRAELQEQANESQ